jgi:hypothetical protein
MQFDLQLQIITFLVPCWVQRPYLRDSLGRSGLLIEDAHSRGGGCYQDIIYKAMKDDIFRPHLTLYAFSVTIKSH